MSGRVEFINTKTDEREHVDIDISNIMQCLGAVARLQKFIRGDWKIKEIHGEGKLYDYLRDELAKKQDG